MTRRERESCASSGLCVMYDVLVPIPWSCTQEFYVRKGNLAKVGSEERHGAAAVDRSRWASPAGGMSREVRCFWL